MRVLLVNPPDGSRERAFPLGLAYVAAALLGEGYEVTGLDLGLDRRARWPASAAGFDVVGFTATSAAWPTVRGLLRELGRRQRRLVVVGGPQATLCTEQVLREPAVDAAVRGEGEPVVGRAIRAWADGAPGPIAGLVWNEQSAGRGFDSCPDCRRVELLDRLPWPDRTVFDPDRYLSMASRRTGYTQVIASRGCRRACAHCPTARLLPGGRITRPVDDVVREMTVLKEQFGIGEIHFEDDSLFEDPDYLLRLCRSIRQRLPSIVWQCPNGAHPDDLRGEMLEELAAAGCYRVYLGLHAIGARATELLERPWDPDRIGPLADEARRVGVELGGYFTLGLPEQSPEEIERTVRFAVDSSLSWAQFVPFRFVPGSRLFDRRAELAGQVLDASSLRRIIRRAYWRFYGSPGRWRGGLRSFNRRNALPIVGRALAKLLRGRST